MKITIIGPYPPFRGGISDFNFSLSNELYKNNELQIINFTTQYPKILFPGKTQYKSGSKNQLTSDRILSSLNPMSWKKTSNKIIRINPDLIIIQYWMPFFTLAYNSILKNIKSNDKTKVIAICHNLIPHEDKGFYRYFTKRFLDKVDKFILMSKSVQTDLTKFIPNAKFKTLFHPIYDLFGNEIDKITAREKLAIKQEKVILFFGLIREYKGLDILLNSIPILKNRLKDYKVVIAGECYENPQKYLDIIKELDIKEYIDINLDFIPDDKISNYFSAADIVVLPYKTATQSGITQIAFNFNRPVIISDVGGLSETVIDGKTGYVVSPESEPIAGAIVKYFEKNKYYEFSENIKNYKKNYSWKTFTQKLMEFATK